MRLYVVWRALFCSYLRLISRCVIFYFRITKEKFLSLLSGFAYWQTWVDWFYLRLVTLFCQPYKSFYVLSALQEPLCSVSLTRAFMLSIWFGGRAGKSSNRCARSFLLVCLCKISHFGPSVWRAPAEQTKVTTILGINLFFSFLDDVVQNPRRGCRRVSNFCMGS